MSCVRLYGMDGGMCEGMEGREAATAAEHRVKVGKTFQKCFECVLE